MQVRPFSAERYVPPDLSRYRQFGSLDKDYVTKFFGETKVGVSRGKNPREVEVSGSPVGDTGRLQIVNLDN